MSGMQRNQHRPAIRVVLRKDLSKELSFLAPRARIQRSFSTPDRSLRSDDTVIGMVAGRRDWCGEIHVYREKLDQLIAVSVVEKHFRSLWNDANNIE